MMAEAEGRKPRADGLRNRERLIDVAKLAFAEIGPNVHKVVQLYAQDHGKSRGILWMPSSGKPKNTRNNCIKSGVPWNTLM